MRAPVLRVRHTRDPGGIASVRLLRIRHTWIPGSRREPGILGTNQCLTALILYTCHEVAGVRNHHLTASPRMRPASSSRLLP